MSTEADRLAVSQWSKAEEQIARRQRDNELRAQLEEERNPSRKAFHRFIVLVSLVTVWAAFLMGLGQFVGIKFQRSGPIQFVLRFYVIVLCLLAILVELEWTKFARESKILQIWVTRGFFYTFIAVIGLEQNDTSSNRNADHSGFTIAIQFIKCVSWIVMGCGALYFLMGIACLQFYYNRLRRDYDERLARAAIVQQSQRQQNPENGSQSV